MLKSLGICYTPTNNFKKIINYILGVHINNLRIIRLTFKNCSATCLSNIPNVTNIFSKSKKVDTFTSKSY